MTSWKTLNYLVNRQDMFNIIMLLILGLKYYEKKCMLTQILSKYWGAVNHHKNLQNTLKNTLKTSSSVLQQVSYFWDYL